MEKTIIISVVAFLSAWLIVWFVQEERNAFKKQKAEYDRVYSKIEDCIETLLICTENYYYIMRLFDRLYKCKYRNKEKTQVLTMKFHWKYKEVHDLIILTELGNLPKYENVS